MAVPWNYTLNVNLLETADLHLDLLQEVMSQSSLEDDRALKQALFRYENYWLPLAAKHPSETLAAPLDVEWMWTCHMLSPLHYQRDCSMVAGRIISHKLFSTMERRKQQHKARALWGVEYPQEPFNLELEPGFFFTDDDIPSRLSCDVIAAATAQRVFYYQVSLPHYRDTEFLRTCVDRYKRFLFLKQQNPECLLVPCHDMDLMWHTHLLHPLAYKIDMETILGRLLPHSVTLCNPNSAPEVAEAFAETRNLWRRTFEASFEVCGGMHRGQPTSGRLHCMTPQQCFMASTKTATFTIEKVEVQGLPRMKGKLVFKVYTGLDGKISKCFATLKGPPPWQGKAVPATELATKCVNYFKLRAIDQTGVVKCLGTREVVGERDIDLRPTLDSLTHETSIVHQVSMSQVHGAIPAQVTTHFCWPQRGTVHLYLRVGIYTPHPIPPASPETLWGPVPLPPGCASRLEHITCHVASHSLVNHSESVVMTCRVLHSPDLLLSAVHVMYQDKMAAVAHLVGLEQLPLPIQVDDPRKVPYLNPRTGERAVLIKNHGGDWAVVVGRWVTVKKGGSRIGSRRGRDNLTGQLMIRVRELDDFGWREQQMTYSDQQWTFVMHDLVADLKNGTLRIDNPDCQNIAEKVALTFSVALLHVLCMPRPPGWRRGTSLRRSINRRGTRSSKWIPSDEMPFVIAAGVLQETPNNTFIRKAGIHILGSPGGVTGVPSMDMHTCKAEHGLGGMWAHVAGGVTDLLAPPDLEAERDSNTSLQVNGNTLTVEGAWHHGSFDSAELSVDTRKTSGESSRSDDVTTHGRKTKLDKADSSGEGGGKEKKKKKRRRLGGTIKAKITKVLSSDGADSTHKDRKADNDVTAAETKPGASPKDKNFISEGLSLFEKKENSHDVCALHEDKPIITITSDDTKTEGNDTCIAFDEQTRILSDITGVTLDKAVLVGHSLGTTIKTEETWHKHLETKTVSAEKTAGRDHPTGTFGARLKHTHSKETAVATEKLTKPDCSKSTEGSPKKDFMFRGTRFSPEGGIPKAYSWDSGVLTEAATNVRNFDITDFLTKRMTARDIDSDEPALPAGVHEDLCLSQFRDIAPLTLSPKQKETNEHLDCDQTRHDDSQTKDGGNGDSDTSCSRTELAENAHIRNSITDSSNKQTNHVLETTAADEESGACSSHLAKTACECDPSEEADKPTCHPDGSTAKLDTSKRELVIPDDKGDGEQYSGATSSQGVEPIVHGGQVKVDTEINFAVDTDLR